MRISGTTGRPLDWTPSQCAAYRGVARQQWLDDVQRGLEPPALGDTRLWNAAVVRAWKRPDEWFATECAAHHGISTRMWSSLVRRGLAPQSVRKIGDRSVWRVSEVRAAHVEVPEPATPRSKGPKERSGPDPESPGWTAKECADYLGIAPRAWRAAVRSGDAPDPSGFTKDRTRVWDPAAVMAWRPADGFEANGRIDP